MIKTILITIITTISFVVVAGVTFEVLRGHTGGKTTNLYAHLNSVFPTQAQESPQFRCSPGQVIMKSDVLRWAGQPRVAEVRAGPGSSGAISGEFSPGRHFDHQSVCRAECGRAVHQVRVCPGP
jgi:hypothetical protein